MEVFFLAFRSLGGPLTSSHGVGFLVDYHFNYRMGHVRGNFDLKTMTARVGSGPPCYRLKAATGLRTVKRELTSSFDRNFLVILLVLHSSQRVRCHLDASSQSDVEVIETVLATLPSRHVSRYMATC